MHVDSPVLQRVTAGNRCGLLEVHEEWRRPDEHANVNASLGHVADVVLKRAKGTTGAVLQLKSRLVPKTAPAALGLLLPCRREGALPDRNDIRRRRCSQRPAVRVEEPLR